MLTSVEGIKELAGQYQVCFHVLMAVLGIISVATNASNLTSNSSKQCSLSNSNYNSLYPIFYELSNSNSLQYSFDMGYINDLSSPCQESYNLLIGIMVCKFLSLALYWAGVVADNPRAPGVLFWTRLLTVISLIISIVSLTFSKVNCINGQGSCGVLLDSQISGTLLNCSTPGFSTIQSVSLSGLSPYQKYCFENFNNYQATLIWYPIVDIIVGIALFVYEIYSSPTQQVMTLGDNSKL